MKRNISKFLSLLLTAVLLLSLIAPAALAAESANSIYLRTAEDLAELSRNCTLDSWSQGKTVYLEADIDLTGVDYTPIPTFGGTFEGQGHTISGLAVTGSGNVRGLFRYIQPSGAVRDLHVSGAIDPSDRKNTLGGLAGENQGTITNCTFSGTVSGADSIGGIAGINEAQGQIINCSFSGSVTGEHYVGGIAGQNYGSIVQCENSGSINTTEVDAELNLDNLNQDQLNAAENVPVCTDIGGITGFSSGILQSCVNTGAVGYAHVGYNIGGIVGRQSGYLNGCINSGTILGRKDVGGIAGQLVPEVRLLYNEGQVGDLLDELDVLRGLIDQTSDDVRGASDELSERMQAISDRAGEAQEAMSNLMDASTDWANENIDEINDLSARLSWLTDELTPILDDATDAMDLMEELAGQMNDVIDEAQEAGDLAPDAADRLEDAMGDLVSAAQRGRDSVEHLKTALAHLRNVLGKPDVETALSEIQTAVSELTTALSDIADCFAQMRQILREAKSELQETPEWDALLEKLEAFQTACGALPDCLREVSDALAQVVRTGADDPDTLARLQTAAENLLAAGQSFGAAGAELAKALADAGPGREPDLTAAYERLETASQQLAAAQAEVDNILKDLGVSEAGQKLQTELDELNSAIAAAEQAAAEVEDALGALAGTEAAQAAAEALRAELTAIYASLEQTKTAAQEIGAAAVKLVLPSVDAEELEAARQEAKAAGDRLASALRALERGVDSGKDTVRQLRELMEQAGDVMDELQNAGDTMEEVASLTSNLSGDLYDVLHELSEMPTIIIAFFQVRIRLCCAEHRQCIDPLLCGCPSILLGKSSGSRIIERLLKQLLNIRRQNVQLGHTGKPLFPQNIAHIQAFTVDNGLVSRYVALRGIGSHCAAKRILIVHKQAENVDCQRKVVALLREGSISQRPNRLKLGGQHFFKAHHAREVLPCFGVADIKGIAVDQDHRTGLCVHSNIVLVQVTDHNIVPMQVIDDPGHVIGKLNRVLPCVICVILLANRVLSCAIHIEDFILGGDTGHNEAHDFSIFVQDILGPRKSEKAINRCGNVHVDHRPELALHDASLCLGLEAVRPIDFGNMGTVPGKFIHNAFTAVRQLLAQGVSFPPGNTGITCHFKSHSLLVE